MIIFIYGQDTYRSRRKLKEIIEHYKRTLGKDLDLKNINGKTVNLKELEDEIQQISMFSKKKLIVMYDALQNSRFKNELFPLVKRLNKLQVLVLFYETSNLSGKDKLFKLLKKEGSSQEFKPLTGNDLRNWAIKEFESFGVAIKKSIVEKMINFIGNDLWRFSNEIRKIVTYKRREIIKEEDVDLLIKPSVETDIFKTIDAFAERNKKKAILLIRKHLKKGDSPLYLLSMINYQFRNLLLVKSLIEEGKPLYLISKEAEIHPYVVKKTYTQAGKFNISDLKRDYQKIFQADIDVKTGKLDPQTALDLLIAKI